MGRPTGWRARSIFRRSQAACRASSSPPAVTVSSPRSSGRRTGTSRSRACRQAPRADDVAFRLPRDEYDLAYGYILTGDYGLAEQTFTSWLARSRATRRRRRAVLAGREPSATGRIPRRRESFLPLQVRAGKREGPDALLKLGVSLSALGEKTAACGTLAESASEYPDVSAA